MQVSLLLLSLKRRRNLIGLLFVSASFSSVIVVRGFVRPLFLFEDTSVAIRSTTPGHRRHHSSSFILPVLFFASSKNNNNNNNDPSAGGLKKSFSSDRTQPTIVGGGGGGTKNKGVKNNNKNNKSRSYISKKNQIVAMAANALLHTLNMYGNLKEHCVPVMASSADSSTTTKDDAEQQEQEEEVIAWEYKRKGIQDVMPEHWIRIPAKADEDTKDLTTRELIWEHIQSVEQNQTISAGGRERADLYRRRWKKKNNNNNNNDSSSRQQQQEEEEDCTINDEISSSTQVNGLVAATSSSPISFTVLQFNTLAQGLSAGLDVEPPFEPSFSSNKGGGGGGDPTKDAYGGFSNLVAPEVALDFQRRKWRLLEVIVGNGKKNHNNNEQEQEASTTTTTTPHHHQQQQHQHQLLPDIIGLEECDSFHNFFEPMLSVFGYQGIFMPKPNSPGIRYGWFSDGCALFWKTSEWKLLSEHRRPIIAGGSSSGNQVAIMAVLQHVVHQKEEEDSTSSSSSKPFSILVVVTHLKASISNEKTRIEQAKSITEWIQEENKKANHRPVLLLGDFNSPPPTSLKAFAPSCLGTFLNHHKYVKFQSAYDVSKQQQQQQQQRGNSEGNIIWTTWKTRGKKTVKRMIDYILYTTGDDDESSSSSSILTCTETLSVPIQEEEDDPLMPLPSLRYPSDHVAIAAKFELSSKR